MTEIHPIYWDAGPYAGVDCFVPSTRAHERRRNALLGLGVDEFRVEPIDECMQIGDRKPDVTPDRFSLGADLCDYGSRDKDYGQRAFVLAYPGGNRIDVGERT